uniref:Uncharacterized protein LOC111107908 n=1 Tax=Crassostrea virginica TaxID=6565 RepID=A0A8B8B7A7_CRAVI|nr:uncharacterized protein LOC111107908 [Crassostrea virginica]
MTVNTTLSQPISINHNPVETVDDFTYLGSVISADNGTKEDINTRLSKARSAFARSIWKSKVYNKKTKIHIYNSNVKSVLLYGSECWRIIQSDLQKLEVFQNNCLRRIQGIFWPEKIRNEDLLRRCNCHSIAEELKKRRFRWLGHVLRMTNERLPKVALRWTPPGKRKPGRPRTTWRRTVLAELQDLGYSLGQAQHLAKDRVKWRKLVAALCPTRDEEDSQDMDSLMRVVVVAIEWQVVYKPMLALPTATTKAGKPDAVVDVVVL